MRVASVNTGVAQIYSWAGEDITTAIFKSPVEGRVRIHALGIDGDEQANVSAHGGPYKAVYAHSVEELRKLGELTGHDLGPGAVGENLTLEGVDVAGAEIGERWRVGSALVQVSMPRSPCKKLNLRTGDSGFRRKFAAARLFGAYLQVVEEGDVAAGDAVVLERRPGHGLTITHVYDITAAGGSRIDDLLVAADYLPPLLVEMTARRSR